VALPTDNFDLRGLRLTSGEGRRLELAVAIPPYCLGDEEYPVGGRADPASRLVPVRLDVSRTTGQGYALRLRFTAALTGPCMRCLEPAAPSFTVDAYEFSQPSEEAGDELESPYLEAGVLDLAAWARDALAMTLPAAVLCRAECAGLCPVCGTDLNAAGPGHHHERPPDARWAKLAELRFDAEPEA
jgi:uncharacterized protein